MTALAPTLAPRKSTFQPWLKSRRGWIGIDIGTVATKLAQVERVGDRMQLTANWIIDDYGDEPLTREVLLGRGSLPFQSQLKDSRSMFRGCLAAATLPMPLTELRSMELPQGSDD